jgi:hypothetical protein
MITDDVFRVASSTINFCNWSIAVLNSKTIPWIFINLANQTRLTLLF